MEELLIKQVDKLASDGYKIIAIMILINLHYCVKNK